MPPTQRVRDAMHIGVISCPSETPVAAALALISSYRIHAVVVTEGPGHLAGILSQTDLLRAWQDGAAYDHVMQGPVHAIMTQSVMYARHGTRSRHSLAQSQPRAPLGGGRRAQRRSGVANGDFVDERHRAPYRRTELSAI